MVRTSTSRLSVLVPCSGVLYGSLSALRQIDLKRIIAVARRICYVCYCKDVGRAILRSPTGVRCRFRVYSILCSSSCYRWFSNLRCGPCCCVLRGSRRIWTASTKPLRRSYHRRFKIIVAAAGLQIASLSCTFLNTYRLLLCYLVSLYLHIF